MFSLFKNNKPPYSVQRIEQGELLDQATLESVHTFFNYWLNQRLRKSIVGSWIVLHEDDQFVYWGKPVFKRLFSNEKIILETFYKTSLKELNEQFPLYKDHYQDFLWQRLCRVIKQEITSVRAVYRDRALKGFIQENQLHIDVPCVLTFGNKDGVESEERKKVQYHIVLDNKTMDLIAINERSD